MVTRHDTNRLLLLPGGLHTWAVTMIMTRTASHYYRNNHIWLAIHAENTLKPMQYKPNHFLSLKIDFYPTGLLVKLFTIC